MRDSIRHLFEEHCIEVSKEERKDANRTGLVVRKKLLEIMDLQADIDYSS